MRNITAELRSWSRENIGGTKFLMGRIYGDTKDRWPDGTRIHTSFLVNEEDAGDDIVFTTRNSIYRCPKGSEITGGEKISKSSGG